MTVKDDQDGSLFKVPELVNTRSDSPNCSQFRNVRIKNGEQHSLKLAAFHNAL